MFEHTKDKETKQMSSIPLAKDIKKKRKVTLTQDYIDYIGRLVSCLANVDEIRLCNESDLGMYWTSEQFELAYNLLKFKGYVITKVYNRYGERNLIGLKIRLK